LEWQQLIAPPAVPPTDLDRTRRGASQTFWRILFAGAPPVLKLLQLVIRLIVHCTMSCG
jgi:hypothetical protein